MTYPADELVAGVERRRRAVSDGLSARHRARLGQFFTPPDVSEFLASLLALPERGTVRLLDPGAGVGSLSTAVVARLIRESRPVQLEITAFEVDGALGPHLEASLRECVTTANAHGLDVSFAARTQSFIEYATGTVFEAPQRFDAAIMNPPYRKVNTSSPERLAAERVGLRASNLYTIFLGLTADLLDEGGQISAIVPRSFANGPYHEPFRRFFLDRMSLDVVHIYEQRDAVFADSEVLQENVVLRASRQRQQSSVEISVSSGPEDPRASRLVAATEVLHPSDPHTFVRIPTTERDTWIAEQVASLPASLMDLNAAVSTGRVVDFRTRASLRDEPNDETVPLIYPGHLVGGRLVWPAPESKKPNALTRCDDTASLLLPNETYVVVKRFSAKEERRRVVAAVSSPDDLPGDEVAFENHLNVFHRQNRGLPSLLAHGLCAYLNCTLVDEYVRTFSGHTQINATDLRQLRYPGLQQLLDLGAALPPGDLPDQRALDALVADHVSAIREPDRVLEVAA